MISEKSIVCIVVIFVFFISMLHAQDVDPEKTEQEFEIAKKQEKIVFLNALSENYCKTSASKSIEYAEKAYKLAESLEETKHAAIALMNMGNAYFEQKDYLQAFEKYRKAEIFFTISKNKNSLAALQCRYGEISKKLYDYKAAIAHFDEANKIYHTLNDKLGIAKTLNEIGKINLDYLNYKDAITVFAKSYAFTKKTSLLNERLVSLKNLGIAYEAIGKSKKAINYFTEAINMIIAKDDSILVFEISEIYNHLGKSCLSLNDQEMAMIHFKNSLEWSKKTNNYAQIAESLGYLGMIHKQFKQFDKALELLRLSCKNALNTNCLDIRSKNQKHFFDIYSQKDDLELALKALKKYAELNDSIAIQKTRDRIANFELIKKITEKEKQQELFEREAKISKLKILKNKYLVWAYLSLFALVLIFIIFVYNYYKAKLKLSKTIREKNEEIKKATQNLEKKVKERTKKLQNELVIRKQVEVKLLVAKQHAEEANRMKNTFLSNVSYQIRTPLNAILGFAGLLKEPQLNAEKRNEFIEHINYNGTLLNNFISDVVDISRIEAEQLEIKKQECFVNVSLKSLKATFVQEKERMGLENVEIIVKQALPDDDFSILTDPFRVEQVLSNLLKNALKYTTEGVIEFGYKFDGENTIIFFVKDTGAGMDSDKIQSIFDRFEQMRTDKSKLYTDLGLGLPIAMNLVKMLGGKMWGKSKLKQGTSFFFSLPYIPYAQDKLKAKLFPSKEKYNWSNKTILIAEDIDSNFRFLKESLKKTQVNIIHVTNGKEALEICKSRKKIDLVLMDLQMPVMNGYEAIRKIKIYNENIPIIAQTAFAMANERTKSFEAGSDDYISKPINEKILFEKISKFF